MKEVNSRWGIALIMVNLVLLVGVIYVSIKPTHSKTGFVLNQKVFNEFLGKKELEAKLSVLRASDKKILDSLSVLMASTSNQGLLRMYEEQAETIRTSERELSDRYTADIWKRINENINEYGKKNGYDFIWGASGNGNLMYANEAKDITSDVIVFINQEYTQH